ncbi:alkaline-phosphatase-like protein [Zychaea mexicana]|uniref:alkaline-phosphatase-like protein n=1 Tax=Zychaea mexicana TaxID=64656 RepID=UPI0022FED9A1|nr:alkaline-phosphatase-like protein [Zychaea mexicana]KAI9492102.1 alkaline-phosphatase-like protein [Zychaea mexicana]
MAPFGFPSSQSLSQRNPRNMQYDQQEEEQRLLSQGGHYDNDQEQPRRDSHVSRRKGFWDVEEDFDSEEECYDDEDHEARIQRLKNNRWYIWRYVAVAAAVGFSFIIFKLVLMMYAHSKEMHNMHAPAQRLYNNGTHQFAPTVVYISLDGFRNDYLERGVTPNLAKFASEGVSAEYMNPSFPSITFPNHWTLATGLYPESHGIVGNEFYDPAMGKMFIHKKPEISSRSEWWSGEPIWATSSRQGRKSAVIMWPGSPVPSTMPDYLVDYDREVTAQQKMDIALEWFDLPFEERPQMISIYVPQVDQKGHGGGPEGKQLNSVLSKMDDAVGHLLQGLEARNLHEHVHVVIVSDHGMAQTDKSRLILYEDILSKESLSFLRVREAWPLLSLRPKDDAPEGSVQQIYEELYNYTQQKQQVEDGAHFQVYLRENVPERFHYSENDRIAPIVTIPDVGYAIISHSDYDIHSGKDYRPRGIHGYDNMAPEMRAIFMAKGPRVEQLYPQPGTVVAPFFNVEVYGFLTQLLHLNEAPNNGTLHGMFVQK